MADITVAEAAAMLEVSEQYVGRLLKEGRLAGVRHGRTWAVDVQSVTKFVSGRAQHGRGATRTPPAGVRQVAQPKPAPTPPAPSTPVQSTLSLVPPVPAAASAVPTASGDGEQIPSTYEGAVSEIYRLRAALRYAAAALQQVTA